MKKRYKILLTVSLSVNLIILSAYIQSTLPKNSLENKALIDSTEFINEGVPAARDQELDRVKEYYQKYEDTGDEVIFLGDSIIRGGAWNEYFPESAVKNLGIDGEETINLRNRLDSVVQDYPAKLFLLTGINDLAANRPTEKILADYQDIILTIKQKTPRTMIYVGSILPVNGKLLKDILEKETNRSIPLTNEKIMAMNSQLKALCEKTGVTFVDYYPHLLAGTELNPKLTKDGLHLNPDGYAVLAKVMKPYLR
jgi:lysophospholipase L1-like esterase